MELIFCPEKTLILCHDFLLNVRQLLYERLISNNQDRHFESAYRDL